MRLSEWKKEYLATSAEVSKLIRQLAFAGIAVVWVIRGDGENIVTLPKGLTAPLLFLCGSLLADFCHYFFRAEIWKNLYRKEERKLGDVFGDPVIVAKVSHRRVIEVFYYSKIILLFISYSLLFVYFVRELMQGK